MMTSDPKHSNPSGRNDLAQLCGLNALTSGSGALGGAIGIARVKHLEGGEFSLAIIFGLLIAIAAVWIVWRIGYRVSTAFLHGMEPTLPWRKVMPVAYGVMAICFVASGCLGAFLTTVFVEGVLN